MDEVHTGGCLCGAVRYKVTGPPDAAFVCHCNFCQRASGGAFQIPVYFPREHVEFTGGPMHEYEHRIEDHGRAFRLQSCPRCSTRLGWTFDRNPAWQCISGGTFDDPNWFGVSAHIFTESAVAWMAFPPDVRVYEKHVLTEGGEKVKPLARQSRPWRKADLVTPG